MDVVEPEAPVGARMTCCGTFSWFEVSREEMDTVSSGLPGPPHRWEDSGCVFML